MWAAAAAGSVWMIPSSRSRANSGSSSRSSGQRTGFHSPTVGVPMTIDSMSGVSRYGITASREAAIHAAAPPGGPSAGSACSTAGRAAGPSTFGKRFSATWARRACGSRSTSSASIRAGS